MPIICSVVYRFRAIPSSPHLRFEIAGFAQSEWYRLRGAGQARTADLAAIVVTNHDKKAAMALISSGIPIIAITRFVL